MAYNLQSLVQTLEQILHPEDHRLPWILDPTKTSLIESLLAKAHILKEFLENSSSITGPEVRRLESRITDAVYLAENVIASHFSDELVSTERGESIMISPPDLLQVIEDYQFERVLDEMGSIMDGRLMTGGASSPHVILPRRDLNPQNIVVGIREDLSQLKDRLRDHSSKLEIIPIVGMGGIGKTTLARALYDDPNLVSHFDIRAWTAISQSYNVREILLGLLKCFVANLTDEMIREENEELSLRLYQFLWNRRYLIVLDDMWNPQVWNEINVSFPDNTNGSRIVVTTREMSVANYIGLQNSHHQMNFLNETESWELFCKKVFAQESCPPELEDVGRNIANDCRGLPLAIHVVGGVLSQSARTQESWVQVARDVRSSVSDVNEQFSNILSLSYNHLPNYLKPCFLYLSAFPEDYEIRSSKLIKLWVAEGFLKPILGKNLEETAKIYLGELVERNLLLVRQRETKRDVKSYIMHDSLRDLCIGKAREEKFLHVVVDEMTELKQKDMLQLRRLSIHTSYNHMTEIIKSTDLASVTHTILLFGPYMNFSLFYDYNLPGLDVFLLRLLRVLDILAVQLLQLADTLEKLVNLRYLAAFSLDSNLPSLISNLYNLQTFIFQQEQMRHWLVEKTQDLFDLPQLRHIKFKGNYPLFYLPDGVSLALKENLQTLSTVAIDNSFPKILEAVPNLKCLGIFEDELVSISSTIDLTCLSKLEALKCKSHYLDGFPVASSFLSLLIFPPSLKKLTLRGFRIPLRYMETVGALPNLQILKLHTCIFENMTWEPTEGEFCQLRLLVFESLGLVTWVADETNYPRLECLVIRDCSELEKIPYDIGGIPTLEIIEVHGTSNPSVLESARELQNDQIEWGNNDLQVRISGQVKRS